jgi:hypothetical protein
VTIGQAQGVAADGESSARVDDLGFQEFKWHAVSKIIPRRRDFAWVDNKVILV